MSASPSNSGSSAPMKSQSLLRSFFAAVAVAAAASIFLYISAEDGSGLCMLEVEPVNILLSSTESAISIDAGLSRLQSLEQHCAALSKEFDSFQIQGVTEPLAHAAALLERLRAFDVDYVDTIAAFQQALGAHSNSSLSQDPDERRARRLLDMGKGRRAAVRSCFLQIVTGARRLSSMLPRQFENANGALGCEVALLAGIEERAVRDAGIEGSAGTLSSLGAHWSEFATAGRWSSPLFGAGPQVTKPQESIWSWRGWAEVPPDMAQAELFFSKSKEVSIIKLPSLSLVHAQRIHKHADFLAAQGNHEAASLRYWQAAQHAEESGNAPLAAHILSQLSHVLKQHGSLEEALRAATHAVSLTNNPLAQFVMATVRLPLGLLTSEEAMQDAEGRLNAIAGLLPSADLEIQRQRAHHDLVMWRWMAKNDITQCQHLKDAARVLICVICKFVF